MLNLIIAAASKAMAAGAAAAGAAGSAVATGAGKAAGLAAEVAAGTEAGKLATSVKDGGLAKGLGQYAVDLVKDSAAGKMVSDIRTGAQASADERKNAQADPSMSAQDRVKQTVFRGFGEIFSEVWNGQSR